MTHLTVMSGPGLALAFLLGRRHPSDGRPPESAMRTRGAA